MSVTHGTENGARPSSERAIPDFQADEKAQQHYTTSLERRIKTYHSDQEAAVRRAFAVQREALDAELASADLLIDARKNAAGDALGAYRIRFPKRIVKGRATRPSFVETLLSFGRAGRLHRAVTDANAAVLEAQSNQRRLAHKHEQFDAELGRAVGQALEKAKETTTSPEWLAEQHRDPSLGALKKRVDEIANERERYAKRLEAGRVSAEEQRDRAFANERILPIDLPLTGLMFYRVDRFDTLAYFVIRDLEKTFYALPYDPRLEPIVDGVFDIYRVVDAYEVRQRVHDESKLPFTILDHFYVCNDRQEVVARAAYRDQRAWMKADRGSLRATPTASPVEREIITLLAEFAQTIPPPRAPQII